MRDIETIRLRAAVGGGSSLCGSGAEVGPLPLLDVADALLDKRNAANNYNVNLNSL